MSRRVALVDGDVVVYRSGFAGQHNYHYVHPILKDGTLGEVLMQFIPDKREKPSVKQVKEAIEANGLVIGEHVEILTAVRPEPKEFVLHSVKAQLKRIQDRTEADETVVYLSPTWTFRHELATLKPYKGNRKADKPKHYHNIREYLIEQWGAHVCHNIEADDAIGVHAGLLQQSAAAASDGVRQDPPGVPITCTIDKDMDQIVGEHYNFANDDLYTVKSAQAWRQVFEQTLSGDSTDNIPGLWRVGPEKAQKMLADCHTKSEMRRRVIELYTEKGVEKTLYENARLVYILRNASEATMPPAWMAPFQALTDVPQ